MYPNGKHVKLGDSCTEEEAESYLRWELNMNAKELLTVLIKSVNQHQFDALVSFVYNLGIEEFSTHNMCKKINQNPNDNTIGSNWLKYNKLDGKENNGLTRRRKSEYNLYVTGQINEG
jgi:lysozyme